MIHAASAIVHYVIVDLFESHIKQRSQGFRSYQLPLAPRAVVRS